MPRILVVEDNDRSLKVLSRTLGLLGYDLLAATENNRIRLEMRDQTPDLILVSAECGNGAGLDIVAHNYKEASAPVPVLAYSSRLNAAALEEALPVQLELGGTIEAPLDPGDLIRLVVQLAPPPDLARAVEVVADLAMDDTPAERRIREPHGTYDLRDTPLPNLLLAVDHYEWSGRLDIHFSAQEVTQLWFELGQLTSVATKAGRDLIHTAIIEERVQRSAVPDVPLKSFEDEAGLLMALRAIGMHEIAAIEHRTVLRLVGEAIAAPQAGAQAVPDEEASHPLTEPLPVLPLVLESVQATLRGGTLQAHPSSIVEVRLPPPATTRTWVLGPGAEAILEQLERARNRNVTLEQFTRVMADELPGGAAAVLGTLALLRTLGFLRFCGRPFDRATTDQLHELTTLLHTWSRGDHYAVLGVKENADDEAVRKGWINRSKTYHPDRFFDAHPRVQAVAGAVQDRLRVASEALQTAEGREKYAAGGERDKGRARNAERSKIAMRQGESLLRHKRYLEARKAFRDACLEDPENLEPKVLRGWAWYLGKPDERRKATNAIKRVIKENREFAPGWYYLARIMVLEKNSEKAASYFRKAVAADPNHRDAVRELRLMERRGLAAPAPPPVTSDFDEEPEETEPKKEKSGSFFSRLRGGS